MDEVRSYQSTSKPNIEFTSAAISRLVVCLKQHVNCNAIRLSVKKTGCSGWSYAMDYIPAPLPDDVVLSLCDEVMICVDRLSYPYLKGVRVDYQKQGLNQKFTFDNPNQTGQCGCGESFTVD